MPWKATLRVALLPHALASEVVRRRCGIFLPGVLLVQVGLVRVDGGWEGGRSR